MSALIPVVVGVLLAFAWNTVGSHQAGMTPSGSVVAPQVGVAVEQAAAQAWASISPSAATPPAVTGNSGRSFNGGTRSPARSGRPAATGCNRVKPLHTVRTVALAAPGVATAASHRHVTAARRATATAARTRRHAQPDSTVAFTCLKRPRFPSAAEMDASRHIW